MSIPTSRMTSTASGFNPFGSIPALIGVEYSDAMCLKYPSAI
jgi:hypothetical protein